MAAPGPNATLAHEVQALVVSPATPAPFTTFAAEHFCHVWSPMISAEQQQ
jgi:hypothetical protein